jgi:hypothetical protein
LQIEPCLVHRFRDGLVARGILNLLERRYGLDLASYSAVFPSAVRFGALEASWSAPLRYFDPELVTARFTRSANAARARRRTLPIRKVAANTASTSDR